MYLFYKKRANLFRLTLKNLHKKNRQQTIFPGGHPPSIFIAIELNFCVRYGNRWNLYALSPVLLKIHSSYVSSKPNNTLTLFLVLSSFFYTCLSSVFGIGFRVDTLSTPYSLLFTFFWLWSSPRTISIG